MVFWRDWEGSLSLPAYDSLGGVWASSTCQQRKGCKKTPRITFPAKDCTSKPASTTSRLLDENYLNHRRTPETGVPGNCVPVVISHFSRKIAAVNHQKLLSQHSQLPGFRVRSEGLEHECTGQSFRPELFVKVCPDSNSTASLLNTCCSSF